MLPVARIEALPETVTPRLSARGTVVSGGIQSEDPACLQPLGVPPEPLKLPLALSPFPETSPKNVVRSFVRVAIPLDVPLAQLPTPYEHRRQLQKLA